MERSSENAGRHLDPSRTDRAIAGRAAPRRESPASVPEVVVRVLGPVDVLGASRPLARAWTLELVAYLVMHPRGATAEMWTTALWPDRVVADPTRHSTVSAARRSLGSAANGADHLPRCSGRLRLAPSVTSDWAQFATLAATTGTGAPDAWSAALGLVRGRPFDGLRAVDWAILEGCCAEIEGAVVDLALRLAQHELAAGRGRAAEVAARRALLVCPYDERLYRVLLMAADRQGNPAGVEAAMAELARLVAGDAVGARRGADGGETKMGDRFSSLRSDLTDWVHPDTAAVYRSLSLRWRSRSRDASPGSLAH